MTESDATKNPAASDVDLSVVIVSWNVRDLLRGCLRSVAETAGRLRVETIVVDNASGDESAEMVRREFPQVVIEALDVNPGFSAANNRGIALSHGRHILALNPDVVVRPGALEAMVARLDSDERVGAVAPRNLDEEGRIRPSAHRFPTFTAILAQHTFLRFLPPLRRAYDAWRMRDFDWRTEAALDAPIGAALAVKRSVLDAVGRWDEGFFLHFEDVDLCARIRESGHDVVFLPDAEVVHLGGRSTSQTGRNSILLFGGIFRYLRKHRGHARTVLFKCLFKPAHVLTVLIRVPVESAAGLAHLLAGRRERARRRFRFVGNALRFLACDVWGFLWM